MYCWHLQQPQALGKHTQPIDFQLLLVLPHPQSWDTLSETTHTEWYQSSYVLQLSPTAEWHNFQGAPYRMHHAACSECNHTNRHGTISNTNLQGQILQNQQEARNRESGTKAAGPLTALPKQGCHCCSCTAAATGCSTSRGAAATWRSQPPWLLQLLPPQPSCAPPECWGGKTCTARHTT